MAARKPGLHAAPVRVFVDADVLFAGCAAPTTQGASYVILRIGELTLLDCVVSEQVIVEVERNLAAKLPAQLPLFRLLVSRCLRVVPDPPREALVHYAGQADAKDLPLLVAAQREACVYLVTFNIQHYFPPTDEIAILRPGDFLLNVRQLLAQLHG